MCPTCALQKNRICLFNKNHNLELINDLKEFFPQNLCVYLFLTT